LFGAEEEAHELHRPPDGRRGPPGVHAM